MRTAHGHHIPFTAEQHLDLPGVVDCGGPYICFSCLGESLRATSISITPEDRILKISPMQRSADLQTKARLIVAKYYNDHRPPSADIPELTLVEVHIVWFSKTLKNWKATVTTDVPDNIYYEVTYNGEINSAYVDVYKKIDNVIVRDKDLI